MPDGNSELRIVGFGACMISGYPHEAGGLFEVACGLIEKRLSRPVRSRIVSLGGFPTPRAEKYLKKKVLDFDPDYVVIQFSSTDAQCPIRRKNRAAPTSGLGAPESNSNHPSYHAKRSTVLSPLRWEIASLIGYLRKLDPITPLASYIPAIERMAEGCKVAGATPIVLSPFMYGSRYTMKNAITYTLALRELARKQHIISVDCVGELAKVAKRSVLQHDGFHLSPIGHQVVGEAIAQAIISDACKRTASRPDRDDRRRYVRNIEA
jgi:lysophospholipase L1-like esterase